MRSYDISLFYGMANIPMVTKRSTNSYVGFRDDPCCSLYFDGWSLKIPSWIWHIADRPLIHLRTNLRIFGY